MRMEEFHRVSRFTHFPTRNLRTRVDALREIEAPCNRFTSIRTSEEKLRDFAAAHMLGVDSLSEESVVFTDGTPLNWKRLLTYLYESNVIASPSFTPRFSHNGRPIIPSFELTPQQGPELTDGRPVTYGGFGGSFSLDEAMSKAVGEVLERYFLSTHRRAPLHAASYRELLSEHAEVVDMDAIDYFLPWQRQTFPSLAWDTDSVFRWVEGYEYASGRQTFLPAQLVYWTYQHGAQGDIPAEKTIFMQTTSGSAGHFTKDEAVLSALLEAIQRDGFLLYWLNSLSPKVIDPSTTDDPDLKTLMEYLKPYGMDIYFVNTTSDLGIPTATCVVIDHNEPDGPVISIGSSAGFDIKGTLIQSAIEAVVVNNYVAGNPRHVLPNDFRPFTLPNIGRSERLFSWKGADMLERFRFFIDGEKERVGDFLSTKSQQSPQAQLRFVLDRLSERGIGYEPYIFEVKSRVLRDLGYHVVRAIVPQLIPLYLSEFCAPLKSRRLRDAPSRLGYRSAEHYNPWPHPFP